MPGRYLLTALQATAGGNLNFLRDNILYHKDALLREAQTPDVFKLMDQIADESEEAWFDKITLNEAVNRLSQRERLIVYLRFFKDQTQSEVAKRLGISQVQVSRLEKKIIQKIRQELEPPSSS